MNDKPDFLDEMIADGEAKSPGFGIAVEIAYLKRQWARIMGIDPEDSEAVDRAFEDAQAWSGTPQNEVPPVTFSIPREDPVVEKLLHGETDAYWRRWKREKLLGEIEEARESLKGSPKIKGEPKVRVAISLDSDEMAYVKRLAREGQCTVQEAIRRAVLLNYAPAVKETPMKNTPGTLEHFKEWASDEIGLVDHEKADALLREGLGLPATATNEETAAAWLEAMKARRAGKTMPIVELTEEDPCTD